MESIDGATHCKWKKIFKGAAPFIDAHRKQLTQRMQLQTKGKGVNGQTVCIDVDSHLDSDSDISFVA